MFGKQKENSDQNGKTVNILTVIEKSGNYQIFQFMLICVPAIFVMMSNVNYIFVAGDVNYRCKIPECETPEQTYLPIWWPNIEIDQCSKPILNRTLLLNGNTCTNASFTGDIEKCTEWVYESNDTIVSELNLGCQEWKQHFVGTIHGVGMIIAMLVAGWMSDRFGRKYTFIVCSVGCFLGSLKILATSYPVYLGLEFLEAAVSCGVLSLGSVIMIEISSKKSRLLAGIIFAYAVYTGEALYACLSMLAPNWKNLLLIIYCPTLIFVSYVFLLGESPRWQILNGKIAEAKKTLKKIAKINKIPVDHKQIDDVNENELRKMLNLGNEVNREGFKEILQSKEMMKRLTVGFLCRFTVSFIYYSQVVNSVYLPGNKNTNFLLTAVASYPGELLSLYFMSKYGRRTPLIVGFLMCGAATIISDYVPETYTWAKIIIFLFGKLVVATCYTGNVIYTMELFPTSVRGSLLGLCTLAACAGNMLAPLIPTLNTVSTVLPPILFGVSSVTSAASLFLTPETRNLPLLDTIKQVDQK